MRAIAQLASRAADDTPMRFIVILPLLGCLAVDAIPDAPPTPDAYVEPRAPRVLAWRVTDHLGREWLATRAPRRPRIVIELSAELALHGDRVEDGVLVLDASETDLETLSEDLERKPLRVAHERALVDYAIRGDSTLEIETETLQLASSYLVAIAPWARSTDDVAMDAPFVAELTVRASGAGAVVVDAWPAPGAAGVDPALPFAAIRFDDEVEGIEAITFEGPDGAVHTAKERVACADVGWEDGECVLVRWDGQLRPEREYAWTVTDWVVDRGGAPVGPWTGRFRTSTSTPLELVGHACAIDALEVGSVCVVADDSSITLDVVASAPFRGFVELEGWSARGVATRGELSTILRGLPADTELTGTLRLEGYAQTYIEPLTVRTTAPLPAITISEVRADPRGPEPHQEYVELVNFGAVPVSLQDYRIADRSDREGDVLGPSIVPPGGRALVVAPTFVADHPDDPPVPPGTPLIRLDGSIASGGLSNAGEPVILRDPTGRRISRVPALASPGPGMCWTRVDESRLGDPQRFVARACRPGAP